METVMELDGEEEARRGEQEVQEEQEEVQEEQDHSLSDVHVPAPGQTLLSVDSDSLCPESYRENSPAEVRLLSIADSFQRQYSLLYPDRKPLLLCPVNECGVKKFVSTSLRPTPTSHPQLYSWQGCASFVADFLSLELLEPAVELPRRLSSSTSVLRTQRATCLESAALLCSLLLGAGYDAYCVSGYAVREMCLLDQSLQQCPLLDAQPKSVSSEQQQGSEKENKYTLKPPRETEYDFEKLLEEQKKKQESAPLQKPEVQEDPGPADPLRGLRVHCWVLVLAGSRGVLQNFFIDPLSGKRHGTEDGSFLGVESVWNNLNYYVNMQSCSRGCADMTYDLEDLQTWEPVLFGGTSKRQLALEALKRKDRMLMKTAEPCEEEEQQRRVFEMPRSWVSYISISKQDLERRWPGGTRTTRYRGATLEKFSPYLRQDGLVTRRTTFSDRDCVHVATVTELYQNRADHLEERQVNMADGVTTERFRAGRRLHLLYHSFSSGSAHRDMAFGAGRVDGLVRRLVAVGEMTETFEGRWDFLYHRHAVYDPQVPFLDLDLDSAGPLQRVVERFHRNQSKPAQEDVAERVFLLAEGRIEVTYHLADRRFIPSKRSFIKPQESTERKRAETFTLDMVSSFQVDPSEKPLKTRALFEMLMDLMVDEEKTVLQLRESQREVEELLSCRQQEDGDVELLFSPWTATGARAARVQRQEAERAAAEEERWMRAREKDVLAPFLIGLDQKLDFTTTRTLLQDCLAEFRRGQEEHARLIQERCEKKTKELQKKQDWYQKNQLKMSKQEQDEYWTFCSETKLQIRAAKTRLGMLKKVAAEKYRSLELKLKQDPRLAPHLVPDLAPDPDLAPGLQHVEEESGGGSL